MSIEVKDEMGNFRVPGSVMTEYVAYWMKESDMFPKAHVALSTTRDLMLAGF